MVGFAEHYVLDSKHDEDLTKPYETFRKHKASQPAERPIFSGVVLTGWQDAHAEGDAVEKKIAAFKERGIDYIRLECNLGSAGEIGEPEQLVDHPLCNARLARLAEVAQLCQRQEMVPLILLQVCLLYTSPSPRDS